MKRVLKYCWKRCGRSISIENGCVGTRLQAAAGVSRAYAGPLVPSRSVATRRRATPAGDFDNSGGKICGSTGPLELDQLVAHRQLIRKSFRQTSTTLAERFVAHNLDVAVQ
jgi:hypothetical protein